MRDDTRMKMIFGIVANVVCAGAGWISQRVQTQAGCETIRVSKGSVSEVPSERPQCTSKLVSEFLPVATK